MKWVIFLKYLIALLFLFCMAPLQAQIVPFEAQYQIRWHGLNAGESLHRLIPYEGHYRFIAKTQPHLIFLPFQYYEICDFQWKNNTIAPLRFSFEHHEGKVQRSGVMTFDPKQKTITQTGRDPWQIAFVPGTQDKLSHTLLLQETLKQHPEKTHWTYEVADHGTIQTVTIAVLGTEKIKTGLGKFEAIKVEHHKGNKMQLLWFAPSLDYTLVKVQQYRNGKLFIAGEISYYEKLEH